MFNNKSEREGASINGSSMADIAFLLLIFFLVTTTINVDTGIGIVLPPPPDDVDEPLVLERNMMNILVNHEGEISMDDKLVELSEVKPILIEFIDNHGANPDLSISPEKAIVSLKTQRETPYRIYIDMLDEVMASYKELRNSASRKNYGREFHELDSDSPQRQHIIDMYPKRVAIAGEDD